MLTRPMKLTQAPAPREQSFETHYGTNPADVLYKLLPFFFFFFALGSYTKLFFCSVPINDVKGKKVKPDLDSFNKILEIPRIK